ncbi:MAG: helix-turn-helix domain-containing protein [Candidatus Aenigmarchaeota archaeon]|nr:helix-turn-helix domain-containing protein [Candidatus Aenigmarchaeota archaeon]
MDERLFREIGMTDGETKVYFALLRLGETKTGPLAKEAGISLSKVYKVLDKLMQKGLAGSVIKGKVRHYAAMEPRRILDYLEARQSQLREKAALVQQMLPQLELQREASVGKTSAMVYEGYKAVTNVVRSIIDELGEGEEYCVIGAGYGDVPGLRDFFAGHHRRRVKKGIRLRMIANFDTRGNIEPMTAVSSQLRFLPQYLITNMTIYFYQEKVFIVLWTRSPVGLLIHDAEAVKSFRAYFNAFWRIAKK